MRRIIPEIRNRSRQLRRPQTLPEQKLWSYLRDRQLDGYKFRRQHPIGFYIVDFYCAQIKLVVEIDGDSHGRQIDYDKIRTDWLEAQGYTVIRFSNQQVIQRIEDVIAAIQQVVNCLVTDPHPASPSQGEEIHLV